MKITVVGTGYVGLVTGTCFAEIGNHVVCVDNDHKKIKQLEKLIMPIYEPGLEDMVKRNVKLGRLSFSTSIKESVKKSEIIFIAVGTPPRDDGSADLSYVEKVAASIAMNMNSYKVIVEKSTVPVETGEWVEKTIQMNNRNKIDFDVVSNPEFLREGSAVEDFLHPDRIIVGVKSARAEKVMRKLYQPLRSPILVTDIKSAELIKHASNSFLATKISFINAVSNVCDRVGADVEKVAEGMGLDKRIGPAFLNAGCGFGGFCFPKDLDAFIWMAGKVGYDFTLLKAVESINEAQKKIIVKKIEEALWIIRDKTIGILGLAFKPNTDDMRYAPSLDIVRYLKEKEAKIKVYDPVAMVKAKSILTGIKFCKNAYEVAKGSDALVIVTEWNEFKNLDLNKIKKLLKYPIIIDGRNIFDPEKMKVLGFIYKGIGR